MKITVPAKQITVPVPQFSIPVPPLQHSGPNIQLLVTPPDIIVPAQIINYIVPSYDIDVSDSVVIQPSPIPTPILNVLPFSQISFFNAKLADYLPIKSNSVNMVAELKRQANLGSGHMATINTTNTSFVPAVYVVDSNISKIPVRIIDIINGVAVDRTYHPQFALFKSGVRIPINAVPGVGSDQHLCIWDKIDDTVTEMWMVKKGTGEWTTRMAGQIQKASQSNGVMPVINGFATSGNASGISIVGGIIKLSELKAGVISHAINLSIIQGQNAFVPPATRTDTGIFATGTNVIPMGTRFRFPTNILIDSTLPPIVRMLIAAIRDFGCQMTDTAGSVNFGVEDTTQYGLIDLKPYSCFGGYNYGWEFMPAKFPWDKLQVLA